jgi:hypothetical protein
MSIRCTFLRIVAACVHCRQEPSEPYQVLSDPEKYNAPMRRKRKPTFTLDAAADAHSKDS